MLMLWKTVRAVLPMPLDVLFAALYALYNVAAHAAVISAIINYDLPAGLSLFLSVEQIRISMKTYSFVRENAIKVIRPWKEKDSEGPAVWYQGQMNPRVGSFGQYLYFLFCPTLLYRDNYPR
jgi:sterol O-acyltransferase